MGEWIALAQRSPKEGETVLAFWTPSGASVHVGCYGVATMATAAHWHNPEDDEDDYIQPTHWQPLPPPPIGAAAPKENDRA